MTAVVITTGGPEAGHSAPLLGQPGRDLLGQFMDFRLKKNILETSTSWCVETSVSECSGC